MSPLVLVISLLEGDKYPTQSLILTLLVLLEENVVQMQDEYLDKSDEFAKFLIDTKKALCELWDRMPEDTLLASLLDPRFKNMNGFPECEIKEAWRILEQEYKLISMSASTNGNEYLNQPLTPPPINSVITQVTSHMPSNALKRKDQKELEDLLSRLNKRQKLDNKSELERWKELPSEDMRVDVLEWWKLNGKKFPGLSELAKKYLAVPASQANTERSFSTAKKIVTDSRSSLKPHHVEKLVVWHQSYSYFI